MSSYNHKMNYFDKLNEVKVLSNVERFNARLSILKEVIEDEELSRNDTKELIGVIAVEI